MIYPTLPFGDHFALKIDKMAANGVQGRPKGAKSRKKGHPKNDVNIDAEKDEKIMPKGSQNDAKMDAKIDEKSIRFPNLRFLGFCREYNVKIVFLHDQGCQKSTKNPCKNDVRKHDAKMSQK